MSRNKHTKLHTEQGHASCNICKMSLDVLVLAFYLLLACWINVRRKGCRKRAIYGMASTTIPGTNQLNKLH